MRFLKYVLPAMLLCPLGCSDDSPEKTPEMVPAQVMSTNSVFSEEPLLNPAACETAVFCDDFEGAQPDSVLGAPWVTDENGATVRVTATRAFSGGQSVEVRVPAGAYRRGYFSLEGAPIFPALATEMFGRMMVWLETTPIGSVHWTFIQAEGAGVDSAQSGAYTAVYRYGGQKNGRLMANYETFGKETDCWDHTQFPMPTGQWTCVEWRFDAATDSMQLWLDGKHLKDMHVQGEGEGCIGHELDDKWFAPSAFEVLRLGWERYQESDERNLWIDDVALGTQRLGCPQ